MLARSVLLTGITRAHAVFLTSAVVVAATADVATVPRPPERTITHVVRRARAVALVTDVVAAVKQTCNFYHNALEH